MDAKNKLNSSLGLGETKKNKQLLYASAGNKVYLPFLGQSAKNQNLQVGKTSQTKTNLSYHYLKGTHIYICIYIFPAVCISTYLHVISYIFFFETVQPGGHPTVQHPSDSSRCLVGKNLRTAIPEGQCSSGIFTNLTSWTRWVGLTYTLEDWHGT